MRIRQVRPEFWTDELMASLPLGARLFYIGLWNVADDAGWIEWRPVRIGALLFPYETAKRRARDVEQWTGALVHVGRLVIHECGCAEIPTLSRHQRVAGKQSFVVREAHGKHSIAPKRYQPLSDSPVEERRVEVRRGMSPDELLSLRDSEDKNDREKARTSRHLRGMPSA